jgi:predicted MPP superfamily phosphohydrolase
MNPRFIAILFVFLLIYSSISLYIGWNGWVLLSALLPGSGWLLYAILFGIAAFGYIIGRAAYNTPLKPVAEGFKIVGSYWFAILEYGLLILPLADLLSLTLKSLGADRTVYVTGVGLAALLTLVLIMLRGSYNAWSPVVRTYDVNVPKQAGELKQLRIAMASDLHLGNLVGKRHLERLVSTIERIKPDLILLPGDILDDDIEPFIRKQMAPVLGKLQAPLGVFAVTGNHEYIGRKVPEFVAAMDAIGIRVLMDETVLVADSFYLIGRKDKASAGVSGQPRQSIAALLSPLDRSMPLIMLDHQPADLIQAAEDGVDLSVSGHTHRGQLMPNHLITRKIFVLDWGYKRIKKLHAIVSSGFGTWGPPIRIGSRSEVVQINVQFQ